MRDSAARFGHPLAFLARFLVFASVASLAWELLAGTYLASLLPSVNALLAAADGSPELTRRGDALVLLLGRRRLEVLGHSWLHLGTAAAVALFLAAPGLSGRRRLRWTVALVVAFWVSHLLGLYLGVRVALADYLADGSWNSGVLRALFGLWSTWSGLGLTASAWILAGGEGRTGPAAAPT